MTLLGLADAHPRLFGPRGRVAGVVLVSTSTGKLATITFGLPAALARLGGPLLPLMLRGARRQSALIERGRARLTGGAWMFVRRLAFGPGVDPALVEYLTELIGATPVDVIADFYPTLIDHDKLAAVERLAQTRVQVICGERDLLTPPEHSVEIAARLPDATLTIIPGTGHQVLMERPDQVTAPIVALVEDVLAAGRRRAS
jgi:pimeloyl-ACP methyl ester carboxylesterase